MISLELLTKRFGAQTAVDGLSFSIPAGQIVGSVGPNGAGKSTTLKMLTGMLEPTSGAATICGFDLGRDPIEVKRRVGFVPDSGAVLCFLIVPALLLLAALGWVLPDDPAKLLLLLPLYALYPTLGGKSAPLSLPVEEAKSAQVAVQMIGVSLISAVLAGVTALAWSTGWFWWLVLGESLVACGIYVVMRASLKRVRCEPME